jgi:hypothetical protein
LNLITAILLTGTGATVLLDLWSILRKLWLGVAPPNYGLVGRWLAGIPRGQFKHESIAAAAPVSGEMAIGWIAHYAIGISYAALLALFPGPGWFQSPTPAPALLVGIATVAAPFLVMQPGMGAGVAASRTPNPRSARLHSILSHAIFGLGLYLSAWLLSMLR